MSGSKPAGQRPHRGAIRGIASADTGEPTGWVSRALCRTIDPDDLFVPGAAQRQAAVVCRHCPVMPECGAEALDNKVEFGVWGGMTERQRRALLQRHPEMVSWSKFLSEQRNRSVG
jgi:WhiB family transcriptional regulator, redox-sensing transcriptional regulator